MQKRLVQARDEFVYIPILQVLEQMLQNQTIFDEVRTYLYLHAVYN